MVLESRLIIPYKIFHVVVSILCMAVSFFYEVFIVGWGLEDGFDVNPWKGEEKEWREKKMDERKETENKRIRK